VPNVGAIALMCTSDTGFTTFGTMASCFDFQNTGLLNILYIKNGIPHYANFYVKCVEN
jgi:hypothetical protein